MNSWLWVYTDSAKKCISSPGAILNLYIYHKLNTSYISTLQSKEMLTVMQAFISKWATAWAVFRGISAHAFSIYFLMVASVVGFLWKYHTAVNSVIASWNTYIHRYNIYINWKTEEAFFFSNQLWMLIEKKTMILTARKCTEEKKGTITPPRQKKKILKNVHIPLKR